MFTTRLAKSARGTVIFPSSITFPATRWVIAISKLVAEKVMVLFSASMRIFFNIGRLVFSPTAFSMTETASLIFARIAINFIS